MLPILLTAETEIDTCVGFRYRTVCIYNENSKLHYHDYYEVFLTLEDNIVHKINGVKEVLPRGTLVFIRKPDIHIYEYSSSPKAAFVNFAFTEEMLDNLFDYLSEGFLSKELLSAPHPPSVHLQESDINWILKQLEVLNTIPATYTSQLKYHSRVLLFKIFTRYFEKYSAITFTRNNIPDWLFELNIEMQKLKNFSQKPEHMIAMSGKCREHLGRKLKQYYGKTISDYINDLRLNYFANCLRNSDIPIIDICYECGFENISWAYSLFNKKFGMTPLKYRNAMK